MRQRDTHAWVYKPLRTTRWTISAFIFILLVFIGVPFGCTLAFLSTQRSLPVAWAILVAFSATLLALLSLLWTLRWWHQARPLLPEFPINQNGCCSDVPDSDLPGALESNAADTPAKNRFFTTWISYQIVRVADMVFGHGVPPHLISCTPFDELAVDQQSGPNVYAGTSRPQEEGEKDRNESTRLGATMTKGSPSPASRVQHHHRFISQSSTAPSQIDPHNSRRVYNSHDTSPTTHSRPDTRARKDWDEQRRHNDVNHVPLNRQQGTIRRHLAEMRRLVLLDRGRYVDRSLGVPDQMH